MSLYFVFIDLFWCLFSYSFFDTSTTFGFSSSLTSFIYWLTGTSGFIVMLILFWTTATLRFLVGLISISTKDYLTNSGFGLILSLLSYASNTFSLVFFLNPKNDEAALWSPFISFLAYSHLSSLISSSIALISFFSWLISFSISDACSLNPSNP